MESKRLHRWWLGACLTALLLANVVGGFSVVVTVVFVVIYLTGATLIRDDGDSPPMPVEDAQPAFELVDDEVVDDEMAEPAEAQPYPEGEAEAEAEIEDVAAEESPSPEAESPEEESPDAETTEAETAEAEPSRS